jgi:DNA-directed RNA polymerase
VFLNPAMLEHIDKVKEYVSVSMPVYGPCIEPPKDWTGPTGGGFHTRELQRANPFLVRGSAAVREVMRTVDMPIVYQAVNALQRTAWAVNARMLDTIYAIGKAFSTKEIVSLADSLSPSRHYGSSPACKSWT